MRWLFLCFLVMGLSSLPAMAQDTPTPIPVVVTVILVPASATPTPTETPGPSPTPTFTPSPTPITGSSFAISSEGDTEGELLYTVTAGEVMTNLLLFALVVFTVLDVVLRLRGK